MKNTIPNRLFVRLPEEVLAIFRTCRAEGFSAAEIGEIFNIVPEQNTHLSMVLPPKKI